jgi:hypothetical protein
MNTEGVIAVGILILMAVSFISFIVFMAMSFRLQFKMKHFLQFLPLVILTSASAAAYYQPNETERTILYLVLFGYFLIVLFLWFIKRRWKHRKDRKIVERYAL